MLRAYADSVHAELSERLKLSICPGCGYNLSGLPSPPRCPECGAEYDATSFSIPVWRSFDMPSLAGIGVSGVLSIFGLFMTFAWGRISLFYGVVALMFVSAFIRAARQYWFKLKAEPDSTLIGDDARLLVFHEGEVDVVRYWKELSHATIIRHWNGGWRVQITASAWNRFMCNDIDVVVHDAADAKAIRDECHRRIDRAAQREAESLINP
jgi:hypothetical protein